MNSFGHTPVMVQETLHFLRCSPEGFYIDSTVGGGGHSRAILEASNPSGRLFGIDKDADAVIAARENLKEFGERVRIVQGAFSNVRELTRSGNYRCANGILADLGVSSHQLEKAGRGFGFSSDGPLDMRMDQGRGRSAADVVNNEGEEELSRIIFEFGEERYSRRIARAIVTRRRMNPILTTGDLADAVRLAVPPPARRGRIHPATRTFQALRIFVNDELGELAGFLENAPEILCGGGRLVIISYHSLEDRLVKNAFRDLAKKGGYKVVTKKIVTPSEDEVGKNTRSRSAKLRVLERD